MAMMMPSTDFAVVIVSAAALLLGRGAAADDQNSDDSTQSCWQELIERGDTSGVHECDDDWVSIVQRVSRTESTSSVEMAKRRARLAADHAFLIKAWSASLKSLQPITQLASGQESLLVRVLRPQSIDGKLEGAWTCFAQRVGPADGRGRCTVRVIRSCPVAGITVTAPDPASVLNAFCVETLQSRVTPLRAMLAFEVAPVAELCEYGDVLRGVLGESDYSLVRAILLGRPAACGPERDDQAGIVPTVTGSPDIDGALHRLETTPSDAALWATAANYLAEGGWSRCSQLVAAAYLSQGTQAEGSDELIAMIKDDWAIHLLNVH